MTKVEFNASHYLRSIDEQLEDILALAIGAAAILRTMPEPDITLQRLVNMLADLAGDAEARINLGNILAPKPALMAAEVAA